MLDGNGVIKVEHDAAAKTVHVRVQRSKISTDGKASIGRMLCRLHVWRCTANVEACKDFFESVSAVDGDFEVWRQVVVSNTEPGWKFVQPNTVLRQDGGVELVAYDSSNEGIIRSFAERNI
jgi:dipeptidyl-peptidase III